MQPIVLVENLSKQYKIGIRYSSYMTLRERMIESVENSFKYLRNKDKLVRAETFWALKEVSFKVQPGEVVGVVGHNGSGKSTLLKLLSLITEPTKGFVEIYGRFGSLLEVGTGFHPELTGRENIYLNGAILGMSRFEIKQHFDEIIAFAEVERFIDTPVKRYSSGMYLRLAFAVAAHLRTEIMLIDEVLAVGDAKFQRKCLGKMQDAASEGRTVIFVSHNMGAISKLCQRVLWLNQGRLELDGSTEEVVSAYSASFVTGKHTWERSSRDLGFDNQNPLWLRSVSLCQGEQENVSTVNFSKEFSVEIEYEVVRIVFDASIVLRVNSESGTVIFTSIDTDLSENLTSFERTPGRHVAVCRIPGSFLRSGSYSITFGVRRQGIWSELHDHLLRFEVDAVNNPLHPARQGVITPILEWNDYIMEQ